MIYNLLTFKKYVKLTDLDCAYIKTFSKKLFIFFTINLLQFTFILIEDN